MIRATLRMGLAALLAVAAFMSTASAEDEATVLMYVRDGSRDLDRMLVQEVGVMQRMLEDAGYQVALSTPGDEPLATDDRALAPTVKLADVQIDDYAGIILPCMAPAGGHAMPARVDALVADAVERDLPIAASRGSVSALARAGALVGRDFAYAGPVSPTERPEFAGGNFVGTGVVRDGLISTGGICPLAARSTGEPDGTFELMNEFIAALNEAS